MIFYKSLFIFQDVIIDNNCFHTYMLPIRHFTLLLNYLAVEAAVPIFRCSLRSYSISIVLNNHGNRVRGVCINVAQETASRCRSEDNQYSVTSLSRTHCGNWKRSSAKPEFPSSGAAFSRVLFNPIF